MLGETKFLIVAVFLALLGAFHFYEQDKAVAKAKESVEQVYKTKLEQAATAAAKTETTLAVQSAQAIKAKDEKIASISKRNVELNRLLANRPSRPTDNSQSPSTGSSCTGTQLYREDGEFLAGEAARADKIVVERDFYYNEYEKARNALLELSTQGTK